MTKYDVFISYSTHDLDKMLDIYLELRMQGLSVWIDKKGIPPGHISWKEAIETALENTLCVVLLASPASKSSKWVQEEIATAEGFNIPVFPVVLDGDPNRVVPLGYKIAQKVDLRYTNKKLQLELIPQLGKCLGKTLPDRANVPPKHTTAAEINQIREIERTTRDAREAAERQIQEKQQADNQTLSPAQTAELTQIETLNYNSRQRISQLQQVSDQITESEQKQKAKKTQEAHDQNEQKHIKREQESRIQAEKEEQRRLKAQERKLHLAISPLHPNNPLHWIRFLNWVVLQPERIGNFNQFYTATIQAAIAAHIASSLAWVALLIPSVAVAINEFNLPQELNWVRYNWVILPVGFLTTLIAARTKNIVVYGFYFILAGIVAVLSASSISLVLHPANSLKRV